VPSISRFVALEFRILRPNVSPVNLGAAVVTWQRVFSNIVQSALD